MESIRILLVDDHEIVVCGMKHIINSTLPEIRHIDTTTSGLKALEMMQQPYDIYMIDLEMPDISGIDLIQAIRRTDPTAKIIVNTMHDELWYTRQLDELGVNGIIYKSVDSRQIIAAITSVLEGKDFHSTTSVLPRKTPKKCRAKKIISKELSKRELEVLKCISQGKSTAEIAKELYITVNTVETHHRHINEKLNATNMASLIMRAVSKGLLPIENNSFREE